MVDETLTVPKDPAKVQRILASAMHNFAVHGYRTTKTDVIAQEADVSKGIIFRYFGNKAHLFVAVLQQAFDKIEGVADYSVWHNSTDLVEMIVRATKYKIELQLQYPDEFGVLMDGYVIAEKAPKEVKDGIKAVYARATNVSLQELITPVLDRLELRPEVDYDLVYTMMTMVMNQIQEETKVFMKTHPHAELTEFTEIIEHAKRYVGVVEKGILRV